MNIVPTDTPSIFAALNTLRYNDQLLALVRPNNPPPGIAGFVFDVVGDDGVELESDITDHYTEENNPVQDHIALHPEVVTVSGSIAEVVRKTITAQPVASPTNPLPLVPSIVPTLAPGAEQAQATTLANDQAQNNAITSAESLYGFYQQKLPQQPNETKQQVAFGFIYQLWKGRQLFTVETPWGFFTNMAIQSVTAKQGPDSRFVSDFDITFKKIRTVRTVTVQLIDRAGRGAFQWAAITQGGTMGQKVPTALQEVQFKQSITAPSP
jgi:hypothetical protein